MFLETVAVILVVILLFLLAITLGLGALFTYELITDIVRMKRR